MFRQSTCRDEHQSELLGSESCSNHETLCGRRSHDELANDIHRFVDKPTHLTTAVLRRCVEMSML